MYGDSPIEVGSLWEHYKGGLYKIALKAVESNEPHRLMIIYQNVETGDLWCHPLEEFEKEVKPGIKRFKEFKK